MLYYVKVQNFNLQQAYRLYAAGRTVGVGSDCRYLASYIIDQNGPQNINYSIYGHTFLV